MMSGSKTRMRIRQLSRGHRLLLTVLKANSKLTMWQAYQKQMELTRGTQEKGLMPWSVAGRLSEMKTIGLVVNRDGRWAITRLVRPR